MKLIQVTDMRLVPPAYAIVLLDAESVVVHMHDFLHRGAGAHTETQT